MGIYCRDKTTGPYSLSIFWKDEPTEIETYETMVELEERTSELDSMCYMDKPSWEAADTQGNVIGES